MASLRYWRCAALLLLLALAGARGQQEEAEEEPLDELFDEPSTPEGPVPPHLLVWKRVLPNATDPVVGSTLTAHFYIQNVGERRAPHTHAPRLITARRARLRVVFSRLRPRVSHRN